MKCGNARLRIALVSVVAITGALVGQVAVPQATAAPNNTFTGPAYSSADCTPTFSGIALGIGPQQWNAAVGLPLVPQGNALPQRIVLGELDSAADQIAVSNLLAQCGLTPVTLNNAPAAYFPGVTPPGDEATLDATIAAAALPANATLTVVNTASAYGFYGLLISAATACGLIAAGDPSMAFREWSKGPSYPAGGCIISLSFGGAESRNLGPSQENADFMMNQLAAQGVIVVVSAGDEGSGGCITNTGADTFSNGITKSVTSVALTNNVATITAAAHGFTVGQRVYLAAIGSPFQGLFTISSVTTNTFSFGLPSADIPVSPVTPAGVASVNFGGLVPQYIATNPNALSVGGTQWDSQVTSMASGLDVAYVAGNTYQNFVWKDSNPNPNCANLANYPLSGGEATGGGQSTYYSMPSYQSNAALASYPSATNRRMIPDIAALAGWPTYGIANYGLATIGKQLIGTTATVVTAQNNGFSVGESVTISGLGVPFDGTFTVTATPYPNGFRYTTTPITVTNKALAANVATLTTATAHGLIAGQWIEVNGVDATFNGWYQVSAAPTTTTFTYGKTAGDLSSTSATGGVDVAMDWDATTGAVNQSCPGGSYPCDASLFPWTPLVGTSAATPLVAVGLANVNAVLTARGLAPIDNGGGAMDVHTILYDPANSSALTDVVDGNNDLFGFGAQNALPGYDMTTGMGVPNFTTLANLIIARNTPAPSPVPTPTSTPTPIVTPAPSTTFTPPATPATPVVISIPTNLGGGVQTGAGLTVKPKRLVLREPPTRNLVSAPTLTSPVGRWVTPVFGELPARTTFATFIRIKGSWISLGTSVSNRNGFLSLPAIKMMRSGEYPIRFTSKNGKSFFVQVEAGKRSN